MFCTTNHILIFYFSFKIQTKKYWVTVVSLLYNIREFIHVRDVYIRNPNRRKKIIITTKLKIVFLTISDYFRIINAVTIYYLIIFIFSAYSLYSFIIFFYYCYLILILLYGLCLRFSLPLIKNIKNTFYRYHYYYMYTNFCIIISAQYAHFSLVSTIHVAYRPTWKTHSTNSAIMHFHALYICDTAFNN